jgi:thiamine-phosphate pyrophosphorylase
MFIKKKNYYFYIDSTKSINLNLIKKNQKICIIYRNLSGKESFERVVKFKKACQKKKFKFYVANNYALAKKIRSDGLYLSAYNKKIYHDINVIGSAHNFKEINQKIAQKCKIVVLSRLFKVDKKGKKGFLNIIKFNLICQKYNIEILPLGGIKEKNLLKLNLLKADSFALLNEIKKKPVIANRLF